MNLKELKTKIDSIYENLEHVNPENISVLITTSERSIGGRAFSGIDGVNLGIDWENNQLRINPEIPLIKVKKDGDKFKEIYSRTYDKTTCYFCSNCDHFVEQKDKYCKHCGQKFIKI